MLTKIVLYRRPTMFYKARQVNGEVTQKHELMTKNVLFSSSLRIKTSQQLHSDKAETLCCFNHWERASSKKKARLLNQYKIKYSV